MSVCVNPSVTMPAKRAPHTVDDGALRVAGVVFPAPGEGASRPSSGAAYMLPRALPLNDEGDLVDLPDFNRRAPTRFTDDATPCEAEKGREGVPSGAFPLPQGPP